MFDAVKESLRQTPLRWLVTGAAGFIGSNLVEALLMLDQEVTGVDDLSTGHRRNLEDVAAVVGRARFERLFRFHEGSVVSREVAAKACENVDVALHQAALGSVPRSIENPLRSNEANVTGFLELASAAKEAGVRRVVYASSSSVYGDIGGRTKVEEELGSLLSPYAVTKRTDELYAAVFSRLYKTEFLGLRYFNVFGRRQDPNGVYSAVIPRWIGRLLAGEPCVLYGDGSTSRDFCYVENVVQANLLAAVREGSLGGEVFNVAVGETTTLAELYELIRQELEQRLPSFTAPALERREFRAGDIQHSLADISKATRMLGYAPKHTLRSGLRETVDWYVNRLHSNNLE